jgi:DNA-binding transcriptional ArsR family regulator
MAIELVFHALGESTRLKMVRRLSNGAPHTITSISSGLHISRQGARKHLQILTEAKVITLKPMGRDTVVSLNPETLGRGKAFIAELEQQWDSRLKALRNFVDNK